MKLRNGPTLCERELSAACRQRASATLVTTTEAGKHDQALSDEEVLTFAVSEARAMPWITRVFNGFLP